MMKDLSEVTTAELIEELGRRHDTLVIGAQRDTTLTHIGQFLHCSGNYMTGIALAARLVSFVDGKMREVEHQDIEGSA